MAFHPGVAIVAAPLVGGSNEGAANKIADFGQFERAAAPATGLRHIGVTGAMR
jgi:hypothetical protein